MLQEDTSHLTLVQGCVGRLVVSLLLAAHLGPAEAAKGSLRAGVLSRGGMRRSKSRHYDHGLGWDAHGEDTCHVRHVPVWAGNLAGVVLQTPTCRTAGGGTGPWSAMRSASTSRSSGPAAL